MHHHFSFYLNARRIDYFLHTNSIYLMINFSHDCRLSIVHIDLLIDLNCVDRCIDSCFKGGIGKKGSNRPSPPQTIP